MNIPDSGRVLLYGPGMTNVESALVRENEFEQLTRLRNYMTSVMLKSRGIGISAPQVGVFSHVVLMHRSDGVLFDMVNPVIAQMHGFERSGFEACLSIPPFGNGAEVPRMEHITVIAATTHEPEVRKEYRLTGMDAVVAQHEIDHLWGVFFVDRIGEKKRREVLGTYERWKKEMQCRRQSLITARCS
jgi:peptide deformylase